MPTQDACPTPRQIEQWAVGRCTPAEAERLATHLEVCAGCARRFEAVPTEDPLTGLIRRLGPARAGGTDDPPSVLSLVEHLCHLPPPETGWSKDVPEDLLDPPGSPDEIGRFGPYRVFERIGMGGMGVVFRAEDTQLARPVALKLLRPHVALSPAVRGRFLSEARTAASLKHDHVVVIYQVGEVPRPGGDTVPFIAMEFLEGASLADWLCRNPRPPLPVVVRFGREIAGGLAAAHARGIVHRDIKPGNVWVETAPDPDGGTDAPRVGPGRAPRIRLLDFGLACSTSSLDRTTPAGTPGYMAPEQARGEAVDHRADLFGLGCILSQLIAGHPPPAGGRGKPEAPPEARRGDGAVPPRLDRLVGQLLAPRPADRPPSARAVESELLAIETRLARRPAARTRFLAGSAALLAVLGAVAAWSWRPGEGSVEVAGGRSVVVVSRGADEVARLAAENGWQGALPAGHYTAAADEDGVTVEPAQFTLKTGQTQRLTLHGGPPDGPVGEAWLTHVAGLPTDRQVQAVLRKLAELNPGFPGNSEFWAVQNGFVTEFRVCSDEIRDISPVRGFPGLRLLGCYGSKPGRGKLADLSPLRGLKLKALCCWYNPLADLSPLRGMQLAEFQAEHTQVATLDDLRGMPITTLTIQNTKVRDLSPVRGMPLWACYINGCPVADLTPLASTPVQMIRCDFRPDRDQGTLKSIKTLVNINHLSTEQFWRQAGHGPVTAP
ncbi:MAG: hypothetical protein JWO38_4721 [Gemmataceae bacterium]|nr:hypothetical protein [Gemmataceae bacterium]